MFEDQVLEVGMGGEGEGGGGGTECSGEFGIPLCLHARKPFVFLKPPSLSFPFLPAHQPIRCDQGRC